MGDAGIGASAQGAGGAIQLVGGMYQAKAMQRQGAYQKSIADMNARLSSLSAADAVRRGNVEAMRMVGRGDRAASADRGAFAGGGVDVNSGSAIANQQGIKAMSQLDALTISHNAALEAVGYNMQAINQTAAGRFAQIGAATNASATIAEGGMKFANSLVGAANNYNRYRPIVPSTPQPGTVVPGEAQPEVNESNWQPNSELNDVSESNWTPQ